MAFRNITIFGAGGSTIGHHILHALVNDGTFNVSVLARQSSRTTYPPSVNVVKVTDDFPHDDLVGALQGQDVVISAVGLFAQVQQYKLIDAAVAAGIKRFIPSEWGMDNADANNQELNPIFKGKAETEIYLRSKENDTFSWTAVATSIWLDWALDVKVIDVDPFAHTVQYWRDGTHAPSITTLPYCAEATLQILKHTDIARNQRIFLSAFEASQRQVVAELEEQQQLKYTASHADEDRIVQEAKARWNSAKDENAAYTLVTPGVLLPEYKGNFVSSNKQPILEQIVEMPKLTLEVVVNEWVQANP